MDQVETGMVVLPLHSRFFVLLLMIGVFAVEAAMVH